MRLSPPFSYSHLGPNILLSALLKHPSVRHSLGTTDHVSCPYKARSLTSQISKFYIRFYLLGMHHAVVTRDPFKVVIECGNYEYVEVYLHVSYPVQIQDVVLRWRTNFILHYKCIII